jgi:5-(carboxyamino)imidazole ribonucleotide synthase
MSPARTGGPILPGATVGVLGSGQLGRMLALAARRLGYRVHTFSPDRDTPTGQVADREVTGSYDDLDAVRAFAAGVDVVTFEFENVSAAATAAAAAVAPVRPDGHVLHTTQNRLREKTFLANAGFPVTPFAPVRAAVELAEAGRSLGFPAVLKTADFGYDGKGQVKIEAAADAETAFRRLGEQECLLEAFVDFAAELSVVAARGADGAVADFGVLRNAHVRHILDVTVAPGISGDLPERAAREAVEIARGVLEALDVVGVLCVEFFLTRGGALLINELAPRPHNSGHLTIDACVTSQFEQQLRAVCGLPLGATTMLRPGAAMANLLGDLWGPDGTPPDWPAALRTFPDAKLHLYGKAEARPGRKMGHITVLADGPAEAAARALAARAALRPERNGSSR